MCDCDNETITLPQSAESTVVVMKVKRNGVHIGQDSSDEQIQIMIGFKSRLNHACGDLI